jgi:two-component system, chemotaxis family, protein-glutamate methylesterase/glutaminase
MEACFDIDAMSGTLSRPLRSWPLRATRSRLLVTLLRSHQERAALAHRMAKHERANDRRTLAEHLERRAQDYHDVEIVKRLLRSGIVASGEVPGGGQGNIASDDIEKQG